MEHIVILYGYIVVLAAFAGYEMIRRVPAILHTPLMSAANFIHGIVVIGAIVVAGHAESWAAQCVAWLGIFLASANAVGGYVVTVRMLAMFKPRDTRSTPPATGE